MRFVQRTHKRLQLLTKPNDTKWRNRQTAVLQAIFEQPPEENTGV
jgi:hypothetical protein